MKILTALNDFQRLLKFGIIGLSGVGVNSGLLWLLVHFQVFPFYLCSFVAIEISIITNFLLNDIWTWADRRNGHMLLRLAKYNLSTAFSSIFINITVLFFLKEWVGISWFWANLIGIGCGTAFNFLVNHFWTYGDHKIHLPKPVWLVLLISLTWRLGLAASIGAGFDEAYYYSYALHPSLSYFDHPPFVGLLAGFFPHLSGIANAFTLRLGAIFLFTFSGIIFYILANRFLAQREAFFAFILFNLTPIFMLGAGTMILPDVGLTFFWTLALLFLEQIFVKNDFSLRNWFLAGICTGLAMLSKYHGGMLGISVVIFLLLRHPRQLLRPGFLVFGISALAVFTPVILWNAQHDFVSFLFQGGRAVGGNLSLNRFFQALGGQIAYLTPLIFAPLFYQMFRVTGNAIRNRDNSSLFITIFGVVPVVFILLISISKPILPHWTLPGYIVLMFPLSRWLAELFPINKTVRLASWITVGFIGVILILLVLQTRFGIFHLEKLAQRGWISQKSAQMDATLDAFGWEQVPVWISEKYGDKQPFLFTNKWFLSGQVALAVQGRYPVLCFNEKDARGFGFWDAAKDMRGKDGIFICSSRYPLEPAQLYSEYFEKISEADSMVIYRGAVPAKVLYFYHCRNLVKRYPLPYQNKSKPD